MKTLPIGKTNSNRYHSVIKIDLTNKNKPAYNVGVMKGKTMAKKKSGLNAVQAIRYRELMYQAQFGDFFSNTEFEELAALLKLRNYQ